VRSFATASSSGTIPLSGWSALAVAMIRPGTLGTDGGTKTSCSTPTGMTRILAGSTPKSVTMSSKEFSLTVMRLGIRRTTRPCMARKPYQRLLESFLRSGLAARSSFRSTVIGWCTLAMTGIPARCMRSMP
jgi:hypothetical protein